MATKEVKWGLIGYGASFGMGKAHGSWINASPTYVTIGDEGVQIRRYEGPKYEYASDAKAEAAQQPLGERFDPASLLEPALGSYESVRC